jgi:hypothetical protein
VALVPFLITTGVIISDFAQMFYIGSKNSSYCEAVAIQDEEDGFCNASKQYGTIYANLYAMLLAGVYVDLERDPLTTGLSYSFGFIIGLFFLNVLIAKISNVFTTVEEDGAETAFWSNRLNILHELSNSMHWNRNYLRNMFILFWGVILSGGVVLLPIGYRESLVFGRVSNEQKEVEDRIDALEQNIQDRIKDLEQHILAALKDKNEAGKSLGADKSTVVPSSLLEEKDDD